MSRRKGIRRRSSSQSALFTIKASVGTEITAEMIGNFYGARSGYKKVTVSK